MISSTYIRSSGIRAKFNDLLVKNQSFASYETQLTQKRVLSYHDDRGNKYTNSVEPHFALSSELQYWINQDKIKLPNWWDVCDILVGYWLYNLTTGKTFSAQTSAECVSYIRSLDASLDEWKCQNTLNTFARHTGDIPYGSQLFNPSSLTGIINDGGQNQNQPAKKSNTGLILGAAGVIALVALKSKKKR